jgi:hypothetical protein
MPVASTPFSFGKIIFLDNTPLYYIAPLLLMTKPIVVDSVVLIGTRIGLAFACRKLLQTAFSPSLRELTAEESTPSLPLPTTQPGTPYSDTDDELSRHASPIPSMLELSDMQPKVLKLNHGKPKAPTKRATRGLGRIAR